MKIKTDNSGFEELIQEQLKSGKCWQLSVYSQHKIEAMYFFHSEDELDEWVKEQDELHGRLMNVFNYRPSVLI